uniref:MYCBP-associated protein n=1 Tax=Pristiophorus japonicus TaxID=55135 RepID=UPI00398ECF53
MGTRSQSKISRRGDGGLRTPPADKKKEKKEIEEVIPIKEEPEKEDVLKGEDILALAIKPEDLSKLHDPRAPLKGIPVTSRMVIRRAILKEEVAVKKIIAKPALPVGVPKTMDYSGPGGPRFNAEGRVLPHSILGSLVDFKHELLARRLTEMANMISDRNPTKARPQKLHVYQKKPEGLIHDKSQNQDHALENWQWHMADRKRTQQLISDLLEKPVDELLMNQCEDFGQIQQQSNLIDQTMAAVGPGKGYRVGSEFWSLPPKIGDELSGVDSTLTQTERGFPPPITHIGKSRTIKQETGTDFPEGKKRYRYTKSDSLYLKQRLDEMKTVLRHLDFRQPDIDQLEVIGTVHPFSSTSVERFMVVGDPPTSDSKESIAVLEDYPDVIEDPIIGPSIMFCGHPARWLNDNSSHKGEVGMIVRLVFEAMAADTVISCLEVINDGTTIITYKWKRLPAPEHCIRIPSDSWMQRFYFNTNSGVILPGETVDLAFTFKSPNAGIFTDYWEFCTHPVLLGGASLQVALWGVALFEDRNESARQRLQQELDDKEKLAIVRHVLIELVGGVCTPRRSQSPIRVPFIESEVFEKKNPKLHYKLDVVQSLKELWKQCFVQSDGEEKAASEISQFPGKVSSQCKVSRENVKPPHKATPTNKAPLSDELEEPSKERTHSAGKVTSQGAEHPESAKSHGKVTPPDEQEEVHAKHRIHSSSKRSSLHVEHPDKKKSHDKVTPSDESELSHSKHKVYSSSKGSPQLVEHPETAEHPDSVKPPDEAIPTNKALPAEELELQWDLSIASFRQDVLSLLEDGEQKERALEQLNLSVLQLSTTPTRMQEDNFYKVLYQLWQEAIDELVSYSMRLREIMGLPEKETESNLIVEDTQTRKHNKKDDKKSGDRKGKKVRSIGKDEEKEKRSSAKKVKAKDDKRSITPLSARGSKQMIASKENLDQDQDQSQGEPIIQALYIEKLYTEVYALISNMMNDVSLLFEELQLQRQAKPLDKCV